MQTIKWELTPYCNLHCRHCGAESKHKRKILSLEENKIIANMLKEQGGTSIRFITKETCMYPHWLDLFDYISEMGIRIMLITNGTLLTESILERLYACNIDLIAISLEGISSKTNDYVRGEGVFERIMTMMDIVRKMNHKYGYDLPVGIQLNLTQMNLCEVDDMIDFCNSLPINVLSIGSVIATGNAKFNREICLEHKQAVSAAYKIIENYQKIEKKQFFLNFKLFSTYETIYANLINNTELLPTVHKCSVVDSLFEVMSDGSLCRCNLLEDEGVISDEDLSAGSIYDYDVNSEAVSEDKVEKWLGYRNSGFCQKCFFREDCNLCLLTSQRSEELSEQKKICEEYYNKIMALKEMVYEGKCLFGINERTFVKEYKDYMKLTNAFSGDVTFYGKDCDVIRLLMQTESVTDLEKYEELIVRLLLYDMLKIKNKG